MTPANWSYYHTSPVFFLREGGRLYTGCYYTIDYQSVKRRVFLNEFSFLFFFKQTYRHTCYSAFLVTFLPTVKTVEVNHSALTQNTFYARLNIFQRFMV